ncbi:MAG: TIR domain-containing protein [Chloroflexi bacterium]|nr:TIR domain-containing protein [Chloroflexota bacterium]
MNQDPKPKVFISYFHEDDEEYKRRLVQALTSKAIDKSVSPGDIHDTNLPLAEICRRIRDNHIADATVTIVLIGQCTWQRRHVDWEISASLIDRRNNERGGLVGLLLPTHPDFWAEPADRNPRLIPQRLACNIDGNDPFAVIYKWPRQWVARRVMTKVRRALLRKDKAPWPDDSLDLFAENRRGECSLGWQN